MLLSVSDIAIMLLNDEDRIKIFTGPNKRKQAWLDKQRAKMECYTPIIVKEADGSFRATKVKHHNFAMKADLEKQPSSYEEAIMLQHDDIKLMMFNLCTELAFCHGIDVGADA